MRGEGVIQHRRLQHTQRAIVAYFSPLRPLLGVSMYSSNLRSPDVTCSASFSPSEPPNVTLM
nr:MAG TPA: hypothetical protein [Caudoviricetes sp.]